ncbi:MAG: hypothetical protein U0935_19470 [Pirellulales bacterium]
MSSAMRALLELAGGWITAWQPKPDFVVEGGDEKVVVIGTWP